MRKRIALLLTLGFLFLNSGCEEATKPNPVDPDIPSTDFTVSLNEVTLPNGFHSSLLDIKEIPVPNPEQLPTGNKAAPLAFDITYNSQASTDFSPEMTILTFSYDKSVLSKNGLIEDFETFYYDEVSNSYKAVYSTIADITNQKIMVYTTHFTIFVITALPAVPDGTVEAPPALNDAVVFSDLTSILPTEFLIIDESFEYYKDRNYYIRSLNSSPTNKKNFEELGLSGSVGIATYNGGSASFPTSEHKHHTGDDYIAFTANQDLDVFLMYDTRGGTGINDFSKDAPWLTQNGFTIAQDTLGNTRYIETTDAVGKYTVYKNTYLKGNGIHLHGNRKGVTDTGINTNYWVIIKPAGCPPESNGFDELLPLDGRPDPVLNLSLAKESNDIVLNWDLPIDQTNIQSVLVRRSTNSYPTTPYQGDAPTGTAIGSTGFRDTSVPVGINVYYSVFTIANNQTPSLPSSIGINSASETILPTIINSTPLSGATGINRGNPIYAVFNNEMDITSLTTSSVYINGPSGLVPATITYNAVTRTLKCAPATPLDPETRYYFFITTAVKDIAGNSLGSTYSINFTTSAAAPSGNIDIEIISNFPDPELVTLSNMPAIITESQTITPSALIGSPQGNEIYQWFLNADFLGNGSVISIGPLRHDYYRLDVIVYRDGSPIGGANHFFQVIQE